MDTITFYRETIKTILQNYSHKPSHGEIEPEIIIDAKETHFELMHVGWDGPRRVHGSVLHIDIINEKIWIQHDGTPNGIAKELVEAGISKDNIVIAFKPVHVRQYTGYAVA
ncbi:MAG: XisI protein [Leptospiraceae bacterium]|nr:XisI protein [Leptospiraceae bacterium]MCP5496031.1 XisI protein [Leptospiraceae bacterium]